MIHAPTVIEWAVGGCSALSFSLFAVVLSYLLSSLCLLFSCLNGADTTLLVLVCLVEILRHLQHVGHMGEEDFRVTRE